MDGKGQDASDGAQPESHLISGVAPLAIYVGGASLSGAGTIIACSTERLTTSPMNPKQR